MRTHVLFRPTAVYIVSLCDQNLRLISLCFREVTATDYCIQFFSDSQIVRASGPLPKLKHNQLFTSSTTPSVSSKHATINTNNPNNSSTMSNKNNTGSYSTSCNRPVSLTRLSTAPTMDTQQTHHQHTSSSRHNQTVARVGAAVKNSQEANSSKVGTLNCPVWVCEETTCFFNPNNLYQIT